MARIFPLETLVTRCKQRCDMENRDLISGTEWKGLIHSAYGEFYCLVVDTGMRYWESEDPITAVTGTDDYALPSDHYATIGVDYLASQAGERRSLCQMMAQERNRYTGLSSNESRAFAMVGANIRLYPSPATGQTYYHVYVPQPVDLTALPDAYEVDVITPSGERFIIEHVAVMALAKEESDITLAITERERERTNITMYAQNRSFHDPRRRIVDDDMEEWGATPGDWRWDRGSGW